MVDARLNGKRDIQEKRKPRLYGWDDEKIYYWTKEGEICVSDIPELMAQLEDVCKRYLEKRTALPLEPSQPVGILPNPDRLAPK